jgi:hypothetical protein
VQPIDRTADLKAPSGITARLFAYDIESVGVPVSFSTTGRKLMDFTLAADGGASGVPSAINIDPLAPGSYTVTARPPAGFQIVQSTCGVSDGSDFVVPDATTVLFNLLKKGWGHCDFTVAVLP